MATITPKYENKEVTVTQKELTGYTLELSTHEAELLGALRYFHMEIGSELDKALKCLPKPTFLPSPFEISNEVIRSKLGATSNAIASVGTGVIDRFKGLLGIHSPRATVHDCANQWPSDIPTPAPLPQPTSTKVRWIIQCASANTVNPYWQRLLSRPLRLAYASRNAAYRVMRAREEKQAGKGFIYRVVEEGTPDGPAKNRGKYVVEYWNIVTKEWLPSHYVCGTYATVDKARAAMEPYSHTADTYRVRWVP